MAVEKEKDRYYTVWKLIAAHGLFPQNLQAFGLISKMHRSTLRHAALTLERAYVSFIDMSDKKAF